MYVIFFLILYSSFSDNLGPGMVPLWVPFPVALKETINIPPTPSRVANYAEQKSTYEVTHIELQDIEHGLKLLNTTQAACSDIEEHLSTSAEDSITAVWGSLFAVFCYGSGFDIFRLKMIFSLKLCLPLGTSKRIWWRQQKRCVRFLLIIRPFRPISLFKHKNSFQLIV